MSDVYDSHTATFAPLLSNRDMAKEKGDVLASPGEVARVYAVHRRSVQRWCERGLVRFERTPGGQLRLVIDPETGRALPPEDE